LEEKWERRICPIFGGIFGRTVGNPLGRGKKGLPAPWEIKNKWKVPQKLAKVLKRIKSF